MACGRATVAHVKEKRGTTGIREQDWERYVDAIRREGLRKGGVKQPKPRRQEVRTMSRITGKSAAADGTAKKPDPQTLMKEIDQETIEAILDDQVP
jgi:hypothetical protein